MMNKFELKMLHSQELGRDLASRLDQAKSEVQRLDGAAEYMNLAQNAVLSVMNALQQSDKTTEEVSQEQKSFAMQYLRKALGGVQSLQVKVEQAKYRNEGKIQGLESALDIVEKSFKTEETKLQGLASALETGDMQFEGERRPPPSLKSQRQGS